jgi:hypothetical protein
MKVEIFTLESINAWEVVDREDDMNVINGHSSANVILMV